MFQNLETISAIILALFLQLVLLQQHYLVAGCSLPPLHVRASHYLRTPSPIGLMRRLLHLLGLQSLAHSSQILSTLRYALPDLGSQEQTLAVRVHLWYRGGPLAARSQ